MSTITLEQVESLATEIHNSPLTNISGAHISLSAVKIAQIYNALCGYATLLRERESAKAAVTDEMVNVAWNAYMNNPYGDDMRAILEAALPMLASARVPDGWQLVPKEPTTEMYQKFHHAKSWTNHPRLEISASDIRHLWQAMLAAAPKHETEE